MTDGASRSDRSIADARRIVLKIGSSLLVDGRTDTVDRARLEGLAGHVAGWMDQGKQVLVVSSGAVALGARRLGTRGVGLEGKQAAAAVGQSLLMAAWASAFEIGRAHV